MNAFFFAEATKSPKLFKAWGFSIDAFTPLCWVKP